MIALFIKLALGAILPLSSDEAYYWVWSKNLAWSYYDHPPMIAWLFSLGAPLEGWGHTVRWPAIFLCHFVAFFWYQILKNLGSSSKVTIFLILFFTCPLTGAGGIILTPDLPLLLFWSIAIWSLVQFFETGHKKWSVLFGIALGLGFCSKYHIVLLPLGLCLALVDSRVRNKLNFQFFMRTFVFGLIFSLPVLVWNGTHEWISFEFQLKHGFTSDSFKIQWPLEYLLGQFLLVFPTMLWAFFKLKKDEKGVLIASSSIGTFLFFLISSFKAPTELNWPIMAYPGVFLLSAMVVKKSQWLPAVLFWLALYAAVPVLLLFPKQFPLHEKIAEPFRFKSLQSLPKTYKPLYASSYQMASLLWYTSKEPTSKLKGINRMDMFDLWESSTPHQTFYLLKDEGRALPEKYKAWQAQFITSPAPHLELWRVVHP